MQRKNVLLPEPEEPIIDTTSPGCAARLTPLNTSRLPKLLCRSSTSTAGLAGAGVGSTGGSVSTSAPAATNLSTGPLREGLPPLFRSASARSK